MNCDEIVCFQLPGRPIQQTFEKKEDEKFQARGEKRQWRLRRECERDAKATVKVRLLCRLSEKGRG